MSSFYTVESKLAGHVIDIQGASKNSGTLLDAYTKKTTDNDNQLWEFNSDPEGSGLYIIKSKLSGNVIDIKDASTAAGADLVANEQSKGAKQQLWAFNPDPAGSGYFFIRNLLNGNVVDIGKASATPGALLDSYPQKSSGTDNQLWRVIDGVFPGPKWTSISWGPMGTGPSPNSPTVGSDGNQCAYQASLSIQQDGTCTFSGYYQNRGDVWWGTAPDQGFIVSFLVYDTAGKVYVFSYSGTVPSAPQNGSLITWNVKQKCPVVAENWFAIAAKNSGGIWWYNTYDESVWSVLGQWVSALGSDIKVAAEDIIQALSESEDGSNGGDDGGDDSDQITITHKALPALPAKAPAGGVVEAHTATSLQTGAAKS